MTLVSFSRSESLLPEVSVGVLEILELLRDGCLLSSDVGDSREDGLKVERMGGGAGRTSFGGGSVRLRGGRIEGRDEVGRDAFRLSLFALDEREKVWLIAEEVWVDELPELSRGVGFEDACLKMRDLVEAVPGR